MFDIFKPFVSWCKKHETATFWTCLTLVLTIVGMSFILLDRHMDADQDKQDTINRQNAITRVHEACSEHFADKWQTSLSGMTTDEVIDESNSIRADCLQIVNTHEKEAG